jgi:glycosyltransferase involved in cell wall biosynthesis
MRLVYVNPNPLPSPDPESLQVIQTAAALSKKAEVHLIVRKGLDTSIAEYYNLQVPQNLHISFLPGFNIEKGRINLSWNLPFFLFSLLRILQLKKLGTVDAVLVRNLKMGYFLLNRRAYLKLPPILFETHEIFDLSFLDEMKRKGEESPVKAKKLEARERFVYGHAEGLICITENLSRMLQERFKTQGKLLVAPDGVDLGHVHDLKKNIPSPQKDSSLKTLLYMGSLHHWKGVDVLLEAMQYVHGARLLVVGGDHETIERYKTIAQKYKVDGHVRFEGFISPGKRFQYFACTDICILPLKQFSISTYFTSPLKLFEYMASGKPVVASDLPSIREVISDDVNGVLVTPENSKSLADGINRLIENPSLGTRLAAQAAHDIKEFTWDKRAEKISNFIQSNWMNTCAE